MAKKKFYAVAIGKRPGIYTEWYGNSGAEVQVRGFSGAIFQGFTTKEEADEFLKKNVGKKPKTKSKATYRKKSKISIKADFKPTKTNLNGNSITIYTDGGCINNPGPGGYGVVIITGKNTKELSGGYRLTTNNRMELQAAISALEALKRPFTIEFHTDSQYLRQGITQYITKWAANDWKLKGGKPVSNADLWQKLSENRH